jgi:hypothetical protein
MLAMQGDALVTHTATFFGSETMSFLFVKRKEKNIEEQ